MSPVGVLYISLIAIQFLIHFVLTHLNSKHVGTLPTSPISESRIDPEKRASASEYTMAKMRYARLAQLVASATLVIYLLTGLPGRVFAVIGSDGSILFGYLLVVVFGGIGFLTDTSLSAYYRFGIEKRFGFNRASPGLFLVDRLKSALLTGGIAFPIVLGVLHLMRIAGSWWWLIVWACSIAFVSAVTLLHPLVIAPIFNRFSPLGDGDLRERLTKLSSRLEFPFARIFVMDGSKRSGHANAYFTGIGAGRRIVLFDTLVSRLEPDEIEAVLAHEIGHKKLGHIRTRMIALILVSFVLFYLVHLMRGFDPIFTMFGFTGATDSGLIVLLLFCSSPMLFFLSPIASHWSRRHEFAADRYAVRSINNAKSLQSALVLLSTESLSNPNPHPLFCPLLLLASPPRRTP